MTPVKISRNFPDNKTICVVSGIRAGSQISKQWGIEHVAVEIFKFGQNEPSPSSFPFPLPSSSSLLSSLSSPRVITVFPLACCSGMELIFLVSCTVFQTDHSLAFCNRPGFERPGEPNNTWQPPSLRSDSSPVHDKTVTWLQSEAQFSKKQRDYVS